MQELIDYIEQKQPKNKTTDGIWSKAKSLLEKEKEQIIEMGDGNYLSPDFVIRAIESNNSLGEQYYSETFKN